MALNKVTDHSNMYQFITDTWNPLAGKCPHKCIYCSTQKFYYPILKEKYSGEPRLCNEMLTDDLGSNKFIFVVAQNDLFAKNINDKWIIDILKHCNKFNNKYFFQSKNPSRFLNDYSDIALFSLKSVFCTTIETNRKYNISNFIDIPDVFQRAIAMNKISQFMPTYVTCEPIMDFDMELMLQLISDCHPQQVNLGANTFNKIKLPEPSKEKILELISELEKFTKVEQKKNLKRLLK
ncbi:MAG: hypothetical protein WC390_07200 [Sulfurimonas sp.]|jgi:DNA repair photolyase